MNVTIIGSGHMANGIGTRMVTGGHTVTVMDRDLEKAKALATTLGGVKGTATFAKTLNDPLDGGEVIILALPYSAVPSVIEHFADQWKGKVVVDISNPVNFQTFELIPPAGTSGAEEVAKLLPAGAKLVKAFNTTFAGTLVQAEVKGEPLDVFIAGDDAEAKATVAKLITDGGLRPLDAGPLKRAQALEAMQLVHMTLQEALGSNWMSTLKILS